MNKLVAAGGQRVSQAGAPFQNSFVFASQTFLVRWDRSGSEKGVQAGWSLGSTVTCVASDGETLYAGAQDGSLYRLDGDGLTLATKYSHSVTCLYVGSIVLVGCSDGYVYDLNSTRFRPNNRFYPLSITYNSEFDIIAMAGTSTSIFLVHRSEPLAYIELPGHENWVKSLDFCLEGKDLILASGAQDRYIRLWRISDKQYNLNVLESDLTTTIFKINEKLNCVFDALLIGHDDWVVSVKWQPGTSSPQLLSASSDSSLIIWSSREAQETDEEMQVWTPTVRLGDVSIMGASTATGATGGFWTAEWFDPHTIATLGRTGSWRVWKFGADADDWKSSPAPTGHANTVTGCAWLGECLVTTSLDQTTRLWAELKQHTKGLNDFCELNRPQIHGFDMNCVAIANGQIVSAGEEKLLRVFSQPNVYHELLTAHTNQETPVSTIAAASVPALGLSNKASETSDALDPSVLPQEAELQRLTLWPEVEKIYGHGYEVVCCDVSPNGALLASCCRANSAKHAIVRINTTDTWRQLEPLAAGHTLTITRVRFSPDSKMLLSVSRDRQWSLFDVDKMDVLSEKPKAHTRIIWDCCWVTERTFLTVSRDKTAKLWNVDGEMLASAEFDAAVTACECKNGLIFVGLEDGKVLQLDYGLEPILTLGYEGRINQLAMGPNGDLGVACDTVRIVRFKL